MSDLTELINSFLIKNEHFGLPSFFNKFLKFLKVCAAVSRVEHYPCFAKLTSRAFRRFESEGVRVLMKTYCRKTPFDVMRAISFVPKKKALNSLDTLLSPIKIRS